MQALWQATQALCSRPSDDSVRHIDWVMRELVLRWALCPNGPRKPVSTCCTGPIGQTYWHQALPPKAQPTAMAAATVPRSSTASGTALLFTASNRRQSPAISSVHCNCTWCCPSQESARIFTTSRRPLALRVRRWRFRARASCEMKARGQMRRQSSWLTAAMTSKPPGTTLPQNNPLPFRPATGTSSDRIKPTQPISSSQRTRCIVRSGHCQSCCTPIGKLVPV